jgi:hypothetical protein
MGTVSSQQTVFEDKQSCPGVNCERRKCGSPHSNCLRLRINKAVRALIVSGGKCGSPHSSCLRFRINKAVRALIASNGEMRQPPRPQNNCLRFRINRAVRALIVSGGKCGSPHSNCLRFKINKAVRALIVSGGKFSGWTLTPAYEGISARISNTPKLKEDQIRTE